MSITDTANRKIRFKWINSNRGVAFLSVLIVTTVVALLLGIIMNVFKTHQAQLSRIGLRLTAEELNLSARDLVVILWNQGLIETCKKGVSENGIKDKTVGTLLDITTGATGIPTTIKFNFCTDLQNNTEMECVQSGSPASDQLTQVQFYIEEHEDVVPSSSVDRFTWLLRVTSFLKNKNSSESFQHTTEFHTDMKIRKAGFTPTNCP